MTEYTVNQNDRCSACGSHAIIVYRQQRDANGEVTLKIPHDVTCANPHCGHCPPMLRRHIRPSLPG